MVAAGWPAGLLLNLTCRPSRRRDRPVALVPAGGLRSLHRPNSTNARPSRRTYYWLPERWCFDLESGNSWPGDWPTDVAPESMPVVPSSPPLPADCFWREAWLKLALASLPCPLAVPVHPARGIREPKSAAIWNNWLLNVCAQQLRRAVTTALAGSQSADAETDQ